MFTQLATPIASLGLGILKRSYNISSPLVKRSATKGYEYTNCTYNIASPFFMRSIAKWLEYTTKKFHLVKMISNVEDLYLHKKRKIIKK